MVLIRAIKGKKSSRPKSEKVHAWQPMKNSMRVHHKLAKYKTRFRSGTKVKV